MTVRHWPLMGDLEQFYSGGFEDEQEDLRKILRQVARWMEHEKDPRRLVDAVTIYPYSGEDKVGDELTTWSANVWLVPAL